MPPTPSKSSRTPRKKHYGDFAAPNLDNGALILDPVSKASIPAFPLVAFLLPAKGTLSQWVLLPAILMAVGLFRWALGIWGYSGFHTPPTYGDFEAQRHWMELTINLPISHWYFHDLTWWGLDYPPLTAYHSWLLGQIGSTIDSSWFALFASRGLEDHGLKIYMRATVIVSEYLIYIPACVICVRHLSRLSGVSQWEASVALVALLMQPGTLLIDHGHFQYNTVMLGFIIATISCMVRGHPVRSCAYFVAALGFKQMALFYAPAVFAYLLGVCLFPRINMQRFISIAIITLGSFAILFLPLLLGTLYDTRRNIPLPSDIQIPPLLEALPFEVSQKAWYYPVVLQITQSIHRIFPFSRGLFEDKVANVWCAIHASGIHKLHEYDHAIMSRLALGLTSLSIIPPCVLIFLRPRKELVPWALATCAWGFFLCSYQVHEKNVLLPLAPMTILLAADGGLKPAMRAWIGFANILATWTMFPLLKRDELRVPYFVLTLLWAYLLGLPPTSGSLYIGKQSEDLHLVTKVVHLSFYTAIVVWHFGEAFVEPPTKMRDLWLVGNACFGAVGFVVCYLWCLYNTYTRSGLSHLAYKDTAKKSQ